MSDEVAIASEPPAPGLTAPTVQVEDLIVTFGELRAVDGVSFSVGRGEAFGLLGPNGAGKTTTLRVITTLLRPDGGRVAEKELEPDIYEAPATTSSRLSP
jgi:ABC-type multidrug transport system ATPase subunit